MRSLIRNPRKDIHETSRSFRIDSTELWVTGMRTSSFIQTRIL